MAECGNHGCFIERPKGQGTNGRCNCLRPLGKEKEQVVKRRLTQLEFYKRRVDELERNKDAFPRAEPGHDLQHSKIEERGRYGC